MQEEDSPIKTQDLTVPVSSVLSQYKNVPVVLEALEQNFTAWTEMWVFCRILFFSILIMMLI